MSTLKFIASTFLFGALLLGVLYALAYLVFGGPAVAWWIMVVPALLFGLTVTVALDKPFDRSPS
ncbi:hypothetical protein [Mycolicibacterium sp.]|uniref:hypothetical protein n=1 Tax=Mycolicibacterium sp. TaxID=2320850 RepID=UPI0037C5F16D